MHFRKPRKAGHGWEFIATVTGGRKVSKSFTDKKSGIAWAKLQEVNAERGEVGIPQAVTLAGTFAKFLADKPLLAPSTKELYGIYWAKHVSPVFGARLVSSIKAADLQTWVGKLGGQRLSTASIHRIVSFLRAVINHAVAGGICPTNPCQGLVLPKQTRVREVAMFSDQEVDRILAACPRPRHQALVRVGLGTGLRLGELLALRWEWVDTIRGVIRIPASLEAGFVPKGKKDREIPLMPDVALALREWQPNTTGEGKVFTGVNFRRWATSIRNATGRAGAKDNGVDLDALDLSDRAAAIRKYAIAFRWHLLRHTALSRLVMAGVATRVVQEIAGHASVAMLQRYSHLSPDAYADVRRRLPHGIGSTGIALERPSADGGSSAPEADRQPKDS